MRFLLSSIGTLGDLFPILSIGRALREAGAEVIFGVQADHIGRIRAEGFDCCEIMGTLADAAGAGGVSASEIVRRAMTDRNFLFDEVLPYELEAATRRLSAFAGDVDVVACTLTAEAAKLVAELKGVPCVPLVLQPMSMMLAGDPPFMPEMPVFRLNPGVLGVAWNRLMMRLARWDVKRRHGTKVNAVRSRLGLEPLQGPPYLGFPVEPPIRLALYSKLFHGRRMEAEGSIKVTGACRNRSDKPLSPSLEDFLDSGEAPIVFTMGSMAEYIGGNFFAASAKAAQNLGRRAVLLTGGQEAGIEPSVDVQITDWAPHAALFPRCKAIVHHGGAGSSAEALIAGRPQMVVPVGTDQPDNARRLERLGVAVSIPAKRYTVQRATQSLAKLLEGDKLANKAAKLSSEASSEPGEAVAATLLLQLAQVRGSEMS